MVNAANEIFAKRFSKQRVINDCESLQEDVFPSTSVDGVKNGLDLFLQKVVKKCWQIIPVPCYLSLLGCCDMMVLPYQ